MEVLSQGESISTGHTIGNRGKSQLWVDFWADAPSFLEPIYRTAVAIFLINTAFDTGSSMTKTFLGLSPTMIAMMLLIGVGLLFWKAPRDKVVVGCSILISIWALSQVFMGHSLRWSFFLVGMLGFSLVIAGVRTSKSLLWFQVGVAFIGPLLLVIAFYLGYWQEGRLGQYTVFRFNANALGFYLAVGFILGLGLVLNRKNPYRWLILGFLPFFLAPLWYTGSRTSMAATVFLSIFSVVMCLRIKILSFLSIVAFLLMGLSFLYTFGFLIPGNFNKSAIATRFSVAALSEGRRMRLQLLLSGLILFTQKPWLGHGVEAPYSHDWLAKNMTYLYKDDRGAGTHNGYVNYLIMGGVPLGGLFIFLHLSVLRKLWSAVRGADINFNSLYLLALCLHLLFMFDIFFGENFGKFSAWLFGFGLQALSLHDLRGDERKLGERASRANGLDMASE